ncbi:MAG: tetratricopeptide repeat protein [Acidimicrobiales bacterium]
MSTTAMSDRENVIKALEDQLTKTPRGQRPHEHAALAYRLGMAYAESTGTGTDGLRRALVHFDTAATIFDPRFDPIEHARVLNAAGAVHRGLGNRKKAAELFDKAATLFEGKAEREAELAAALNNLGLVRSEQGQFEGAVEAFERAVDLFDTSTPDGRRGRIATLLNRGQAHAAQGTEGLELALSDYGEALGEVDMEEAPLHFGLLQFNMGVALSSLANGMPDERERLLQEAVAAFKESLMVFRRDTFTYQFALAKHNLGLAYVGLGGVVNLRRSLASFEDTVSMLDTRVHGDAWRQAYANLERTENNLKVEFPGLLRIDHFVMLLSQIKADERHALLRERLFHLMALNEPQRTQFLIELDLAMAKLGAEKSRPIMEDELSIVIEFPNERMELALHARYQAHLQIHDEEARLEADTALDLAIGEALGGPQRVLTRDHLSSLGWERP